MHAPSCVYVPFLVSASICEVADSAAQRPSARSRIVLPKRPSVRSQIVLPQASICEVADSACGLTHCDCQIHAALIVGSLLIIFFACRRLPSLGQQMSQEEMSQLEEEKVEISIDGAILTTEAVVRRNQSLACVYVPFLVSASSGEVTASVCGLTLCDCQIDAALIVVLLTSAHSNKVNAPPCVSVPFPVSASSCEVTASAAQTSSGEVTASVCRGGLTLCDCNIHAALIVVSNAVSCI